MNVINKSVSLHFHADRTQQYGLGSAESLGWGSAERQERRFQELLLIGDLHGCSVWDEATAICAATSTTGGPT